jgi:hypothetical protein
MWSTGACASGTVSLSLFSLGSRAHSSPLLSPLSFCSFCCSAVNSVYQIIRTVPLMPTCHSSCGGDGRCVHQEAGRILKGALSYREEDVSRSYCRSPLMIHTQ